MKYARLVAARVMLPAIAMVFCLPSDQTIGKDIQPGDAIITIHPAPVMVESEKRLVLEAGSHLTALNVKEGWVGVAAERNGEMTRGWILEKYVLKPPVAQQWIDADDSQVVVTSVDGQLWWSVFNSPVLDALMYDAYQGNPTLRAADLRILEARARDNSGLAQSSDTVNRSEASLAPLSEDHDDILVKLQADVASAYVNLRSAEDRQRSLRYSLEHLEHTLSLSEALFKAGRTSRFDSLRFRTDLAAARAMEAGLETERRKAMHGLCVLLGMPPQRLAEKLGPGSTPALPPTIVVGTPADMLRGRPDVRRAERRLLTEFGRLGPGSLDSYARAMQSDADRGGEQEEDTLDRLEPEEARILTAVREYEQVVLRAGEEVENAIAGFLNEQSRVQSLTESVEAATQALELAMRQYENGAADYRVVSDAQRALLLRRVTLGESLGFAALHWIAVHRATGVGASLNRLPQPPPAGIQLPAGPEMEGIPELTIPQRVPFELPPPSTFAPEPPPLLEPPPGSSTSPKTPRSGADADGAS